MALKIKEEPEDLWTTQESEITRFPSIHVPVKSEDDEKKPQLSQLHQGQTEEKRKEPAGEGCGGSEPASSFHPRAHLQTQTDQKNAEYPVAEIEVSCEDWEETGEAQSVCDDSQMVLICPECGKTFCGEENLEIHIRSHAGERPFSCTICGKTFTQKGYLTNHMEVHTEEKRFMFCACGKRFASHANRKKHKCDHVLSQHQQRKTKAKTNRKKK
uniref:C2H2-type domain-containing protein n=1 Tax=Sphaeramia orbicularis TaxID=375764 RepID=A0A672ZAJ2_9TELE